MNHNEIIDRLKDGNKRFVSDNLNRGLQNQDRRSSLTKGQEPFAIVLSCADSRVVPELAFDTGLGELFVIRVAGNVANTETVASIEYAVAHCNCSMIVVLGHESCGAVKAAIDGGDNGSNINQLLSHITPAVSTCGEGADIKEIIVQNTKNTITNLEKNSEIISSAMNKNEVKVLGAYYELGTGKVQFIN